VSRSRRKILHLLFNPRYIFVLTLFTGLICIGAEQITAATKSVKPPTKQVLNKPLTQKNEGDQNQWQVVRMRVTAYCPCRKCCGEYADGITASGHKIQTGDAFVAADTSYPFGTEMIVPGYNNDQPVKVLDRGGAIRGNRLDVFFHSHQQALKWGVKYLDVKVRLPNQNSQ